MARLAFYLCSPQQGSIIPLLQQTIQGRSLRLQFIRQWLHRQHRHVKSFDCGRDTINTYLRRYAAKNMALNLNRTFVLPYASEENSEKSHVAACYTLAHQTLVREELPDPSRLPRYPVPVILLAQLGIDRRFHRQGLGAKTLVHALRHAYEIVSNPNGIPALGIVLDVLDQDAPAFYRSFDFFLPLTDSPMKLFVPMASLETL